jgi:hypothetical protein
MTCCTACAEAARITGRDEHDVLNRPFIGRPIGKLESGDVIRSFGYTEPEHVLGDVTREGRQVFVQWRDRSTREPLGGAIALTLRRAER